MAEAVKLGWASARVEDSRLTVPLDGKLPDGWKETFQRTVKLLGGGEWGEIEVKKDRVQVTDVGPGTEDKLRHHLEAIVAQANAALEAGEQDAQEDDDGSDGREDEQPSGPDAEMTARFRSFSQEDENGDE